MKNITSSEPVSYLSIDDIIIKSRFLPRVAVGSNDAESCIIVIIHIDGTPISDDEFIGSAGFIKQSGDMYIATDYCMQDSSNKYSYCIVLPSVGASRGYIGTSLSNKSIPGYAQIAFLG